MHFEITIWAQEGCTRCEQAKAWFAAHGHEVTVRDLDGLAREPIDIRNTVMADLQLQNGALPLVYRGNETTGTVMTPEEVDALMEAAEQREGTGDA